MTQNGARQGKSDAPSKRRWTSTPAYGGKLFVAALLVSALVHLFSGYKLGGVRDHGRFFKLPPNTSVKVRIVDNKKKDELAQKKPEEKKPEEKKPDAQKILEMPQQKTVAPDQADHLGTVDHKAVKEQRISEKAPRERAKDPGQKGKPDAQPAQQVAETKTPPQLQPELLAQPQPPSPSNVQEAPQDGRKGLDTKAGTLAMEAFRQKKPRNQYEALLPTNSTDLPGQLDAGYQDYVDDKIQEGDRIDINTTEYRYIGYFTNMRKAIELVWNYPMDAARKGLQGEVGLEFAIGKDGRASKIRVIRSSGYDVLDRAIVEAIKLASPFSPLPDGFKKDRLVITGSFRYVLNSFGSH